LIQIKLGKFTEHLCIIQEQKLEAADTALLKATTVSKVKKAIQVSLPLKDMAHLDISNC